MEFAGCLYRLFHWHMAHTVIVALEGVDQSNLNEWCEIMDAEILNSFSDPILGPVIWRGSFQLNSSTNTYPGFQFRLDPFKNEVVFRDVAEGPGKEQQQLKHLVVSPVLQVIHECRFTSIPVYLILPISFRVCLCEENIFNAISKTFLKCIKQKNGVALIVRLGYSLLDEKPKPDKSMCTNKWLKMVSSGNIKSSGSCFPAVDKYLTFAITTSLNSNDIVAYPLRDPSHLDANCYFTAVSLFPLMTSKSPETDKKLLDTIQELKLPHLSKLSFQSLINKINALGLCSKEKDCSKEHLMMDGGCCLSSMLEYVRGNSTCSTTIPNKSVCNITKEEIDPFDWPERVHLLQKQIQREKEIKQERPNVFLNLSPQRSQCNISFVSQDAEKYFQPSGEAKDLTNTEPITTVSSTVKRIEQEFDKILKTEWPDVLKCVYDDVYYNSGKQVEDKELIGNEMVRFYVQHETASTCNRQQDKLDPTIVIRTKSKPPKQKWRSPATPRSFLRMKQKLLSKKVDKVGKIVSHAISNKKSTVKLKKSNSETGNIGKVQRTNKEFVKRHSLPVRCSPRKKSQVKYAQPSTLRSSDENKRRNSDPSQLPELLKKKLRVAVASALENHGIPLSDPFFRPCGKRLFTICQAFVQDLPLQKGSTSQHLQKIADAHVKQVIEFEKQKEK